MNLLKLTQGLIAADRLGASAELAVTGLTLDSRQVKPGYVFFANRRAITGSGAAYIEEALHLGAVAVFCEMPHPTTHADNSVAVPVLHIANYREALGAMASRYYDHPSQALSVIGVTGTNGKTSTAYCVASVLNSLGFTCGFIGTLGRGFPVMHKPLQDIDGFSSHAGALLTTPDVISVHSTLAALRDQGARAVVMEVSSHALAQKRVAAVKFESAIFTNLTREHIDYHGSMENYAAVKQQLFEWPGLKHVILNRDDAMGRKLIQLCRDKDRHLCTYGYLDKQSVADQPSQRLFPINAVLEQCDRSGFCASVNTPWGQGELRSPLLGAFNLSNLLPVLGLLGLMGIPFAKSVAKLAEFTAVPGRMQSFGGRDSLPLVVVDYAHTPDGLKKALQSLRDLCQNETQLWCVFGCGGDRDAGKRTLMGEIAETYSDHIIVTNDNPRSEDPDHIITAICAGMGAQGRDKTIIQPDRGAAILQAITQAAPADIVLIAGKGHEEYQLVGDRVSTFSDSHQVEEALKTARARV